MINANEKRAPSHQSNHETQAKASQKNLRSNQASSNSILELNKLSSRNKALPSTLRVDEDSEPTNDDDFIYFDEDNDGTYATGNDPYENNVNELFSNFNADNINDYYYYLNQLLFNSNNNVKND